MYATINKIYTLENFELFEIYSKSDFPYILYPLNCPCAHSYHSFPEFSTSLYLSNSSQNHNYYKLSASLSISCAFSGRWLK